MKLALKTIEVRNNWERMKLELSKRCVTVTENRSKAPVIKLIKRPYQTKIDDVYES